MSLLTKKLLRNIDFENIRRKRNVNFELLHRTLKNENEFTPIIEKEIINGPMVYPFLKKGNNRLRDVLIKNKVFVARYWPNVLEWIKSKNVFEKHLYDNLLPLPIDQRYEDTHISRILDIINL